MQGSKSERKKKEIVGTVLSDAMNKTIIVEVSRLTVHPVFKKRIRRFNTYAAHDEKNEAKIGDLVKIVQTKPLSKSKRWKLEEVVEKM